MRDYGAVAVVLAEEGAHDEGDDAPVEGGEEQVHADLRVPSERRR